MSKALRGARVVCGAEETQKMRAEQSYATVALDFSVARVRRRWSVRAKTSVAMKR
jgi:hypothetical protein